jgi:alkaline phosphatase
MVQTPDRARRRLAAVTAALLGLALLATAHTPTLPIGAPSATPSASDGPSPSGPPPEAVLLAVGDIASCDVSADEQVGELAARLDGTIALLGDIAYPRGSSDDFAGCFDPTWGPMRNRLRPAPGNHEYESKNASGYFAYFGAAAGKSGEGWYSYDLGAWHLIALNSNCEAIGGCGRGSPQLAWLVADLAAHPAACTLAYWHHPRWSSGPHGTSGLTDALWDALVTSSADVVLSGHDHDYERMSRSTGSAPSWSAPVDGASTPGQARLGRDRGPRQRYPGSSS